MNTSHTTIPNKPPVEVIEAMIEASLANKHNVEAIYKAVINYFETKSIQMTKEFKGDQIATVAIGKGVTENAGTPSVTLEVTIGAEGKRATGFLNPEIAMQLSKSLFEAAVHVIGM